MRLIAHRQLTGDYGTVTPGMEFECEEGIGRSLQARGLASAIPFRSYETKVVVPALPEVRPLPDKPFRDVPDSDDAEPDALATVRDSVREASEVPEPGDTHPVERRKRGRPRLR